MQYGMQMTVCDGGGLSLCFRLADVQCYCQSEQTSQPFCYPNVMPESGLFATCRCPHSTIFCMHNVVCSMCAAFLGDAFLEGALASARFTELENLLVIKLRLYILAHTQPNTYVRFQKHA